MYMMLIESELKRGKRDEFLKACSSHIQPATGLNFWKSRQDGEDITPASREAEREIRDNECLRRQPKSLFTIPNVREVQPPWKNLILNSCGSRD